MTTKSILSGLTGLVSIRFLVDDARGALDLYTTNFADFAIDFYHASLAFCRLRPGRSDHHGASASAHGRRRGADQLGNRGLALARSRRGGGASNVID